GTFFPVGLATGRLDPGEGRCGRAIDADARDQWRQSCRINQKQNPGKSWYALLETKAWAQDTANSHNQNSPRHLPRKVARLQYAAHSNDQTNPGIGQKDFPL